MLLRTHFLVTHLGSLAKRELWSKFWLPFLEGSVCPSVSIHRCASHAHRTSYAMDKAYMRQAEASPEVEISFRYRSERLHLYREFNVCRRLDELVQVGLSRIENNLLKELQKHVKKGKKTSPAEGEESLPIPKDEIIAEFFDSATNKSIVDITFAELLETNLNGLRLRVIDKIYEVGYNEPWVVNLVLPKYILAGFLLCPSKVEMRFAERDHCRAVWYKAQKPASGDLEKGAKWQECGTGLFYETTNNDIGYHMKLTLWPGDETGLLGPPVEAITKNAIEPGPGPCPFENRHCFTQQRLSGNSLRVVSYNILADLYADSDYARANLFPYLPFYALKINYRKQLLLKELIGYNADIVCLQEVDMKIFNSELKPVLSAPDHRFGGVIAQKGTTGEGVATFYRRDRFELLATHELNIGSNIQSLPEFESLWNKISSNEKLVTRICDRSTTLQVTVLKCKESGRILLVNNTHLYFHPDADHIRLLQIGFSMLYIEQLYKKTLAELQLTEEQLAIIFCGDFNSTPECGIYKLMTERFVEEGYIDFKSNTAEAVENVSLSQPFNMKSACGTPKYTNFTPMFSACLDYIFYQSDRMDVEQVIPLPTDEELSAHIAIPSVVFPSDHVALVADLRLK